MIFTFDWLWCKKIVRLSFDALETGDGTRSDLLDNFFSILENYTTNETRVLLSESNALMAQGSSNIDKDWVVCPLNGKFFLEIENV